jgi:leucyl aminopeptidase
MRIEYLAKPFRDVACDMLAFPVFEEETEQSHSLRMLAKATRGTLRFIFHSGEFKAELHQTCCIHRPAGLKARRLLLVGAGKKKLFDTAKLREIVGASVRAARSSRCKTVGFCQRPDQLVPFAARVASEGAIYADFEADFYKTRDKDKEGRDIGQLFLVGGANKRRIEIEREIGQGVIIGEAVNFARTLANEPSNVLTPSQFAERATAVSVKAGLEVQVLERDEMERLGMNTLLAVSRGSDEPPKILIVRIKGQEEKRRGNSPLYAFVGKGVTFDSGGISIKPADKMEDMKTDMAGGAAVLGAMVALAQIRTPHRVIGLIPAVENLPSGKAVKPGDVVKSYLGKTVEIINTDAEGRLIMADALAYARSLGATHLIDIATLTGACVIALGKVNGGMMGTDQKTMDRLRENISITGEKLWQLPLDDEYHKAIRSEIADLKNVGGREGGAITAAKFLQEFVEDTPWVHIDIAAMDLDHDGRPFACKGATGFGVRTLIQLLL